MERTKMTNIGKIYRDYAKRNIKQDSRASQEWKELFDWYDIG